MSSRRRPPKPETLLTDSTGDCDPSPIRGLFPPIRGLFPPIRGLFPPIRGLFPPIRGLFPPIRGLVPPIRGLFPPIRGLFPPGSVIGHRARLRLPRHVRARRRSVIVRCSTTAVEGGAVDPRLRYRRDQDRDGVRQLGTHRDAAQPCGRRVCRLPCGSRPATGSAGIHQSVSDSSRWSR
jgi:hypothetical protein